MRFSRATIYLKKLPNSQDFWRRKIPLIGMNQIRSDWVVSDQLWFWKDYPDRSKKRIKLNADLCYTFKLVAILDFRLFYFDNPVAFKRRSKYYALLACFTQFLSLYWDSRQTRENNLWLEAAPRYRWFGSQIQMLYDRISTKIRLLEELINELLDWNEA